MSTGIVLLLNSLRRVRFLVLTMGFLLAGFQVFLTLVAGSIENSGGFADIADLIPDFMRQLMGPAFVSLMSFSGILCVGYFHVAVMGALIGLTIAIATEPAGEIDKGFMDLILARPVARPWVIARSAVLLVVCSAFVLLMMTLGTWTGVRYLAPATAVGPSFELIRSLAFNLFLLMYCWGGVTLALSAISKRRGVAGAFAGLAALSMFLLDYIARAWAPAEKVASLSPFRYYSPLDLVTGGAIPGKHILVLFGAGTAGMLIAFLFFSRRDI